MYLQQINSIEDGEDKCKYCGRSYLTKDGKLLGIHNRTQHESACSENKKIEEKATEKKKRRGPLNKFLKPKKICVGDSSNVSVNVENLADVGASCGVSIAVTATIESLGDIIEIEKVLVI